MKRLASVKEMKALADFGNRLQKNYYSLAIFLNSMDSYFFTF